MQKIIYYVKYLCVIAQASHEVRRMLIGLIGGKPIVWTLLKYFWGKSFLRTGRNGLVNDCMEWDNDLILDCC